MFEGEGIVYRATKESQQKLIVEWLVDVYTSMPGQTIRNAWMKKGSASFKTTNQQVPN
jgi:hypothetical protein